MFDMQGRNYLNFILKEKIQFEELNFLTRILIINTKKNVHECFHDKYFICWDVLSENIYDSNKLKP